MNITLFGGSFNPPHLGHEIVLEQIFNLKLIPNLDQIWLLPEYRHSFAKNRNLIEAKQRLAMLHFLVRSWIKLQTCCLDQQMSGNTIEHIAYLKRKFPRHQFSFLIGSDNLASFTKWPQWPELLKLMPFYVYPRLGFPFQPLYPNMKPLTHPEQIITNISSTMVRQRIKANLIIDHLVPIRIAAYIKKNSLF